MRVLILDTCYRAFLDAHYAERPELDGTSYRDQWRSLMDRFFGTSDSYSHFLAALGHHAHEIVVNCDELQRAWAHEHGIKRRVLGLRDRPLVLAQAEEFCPDVVYVQDLNAISPRLLQQLRARTRLLVGQIASGAPPHRQLASFQLLLTSFPHFVPRFRGMGIASEYFRLGFDPRVLEHIGNDPSTADVVFVGALSRGQHAGGNELLARAARRVQIEFWGYDVGAWPANSAIRRGYRGEAWGLDMYRVLAGSKIALNRHIDASEDYANNMRLYEATGAGALLITDAKRNLSDLFEPGTEVVTYATEDELVRMIDYYLGQEDERLEIARSGQERTLREHTCTQRMQELVEILSRHVP
jgi:spore maturation protein CgeB